MKVARRGPHAGYFLNPGKESNPSKYAPVCRPFGDILTVERETAWQGGQERSAANAVRVNFQNSFAWADEACLSHLTHPDFWRVATRLASIEAPIRITTTASDAAVGTRYQGAINIFAPMKVSTIARPYFSK